MVLETFIKLLKVFGNNDKMRDFTMSVVKSQIFKQLQNSFTKDLNKADFSNNFIFKATSDSLLLYIHIPFCSTLCTICKFNRTKNMKLMEPYVESLVKDIKTRFINQPDIKNKKVLACYFGGGTPSLLSNELLEKIISTLKDTFTFDNETQISIEGNPESLSDEFIKSCKKLNVSRISIGGQSFNQKILDKMNRKHSASMMKDVIKRIKNEGLSYSMDYVYGWDFQTEEDMIEDIQTGIDLGIPHFSLYNLTPGLPGKLYNRNKELIKNMHKLYDAARETLLKNNYTQYTFENFTKDIRCKYTTGINSYPTPDVISFGIGTYGWVGNMGYLLRGSVEEYIENLKNDALPMYYFLIKEEYRLLNRLFLSLNLFKVDINSFGDEIKKYKMCKNFIDILEYLKIIEITGNNIIVNEKHYFTLSAIMSDMVFNVVM